MFPGVFFFILPFFASKMSKRKMSARDKSLTGGTGDVKPQILSVGGVNSAVNLTRQISFANPVPRIGSTPNRATIMEILKVWFFGDSVSDQAYEEWAYLSTRGVLADGTASTTLQGAMIAIQDQGVIAGMTTNYQIITSGAVAGVNPVQIDLTDGAGNGVLIATDNLVFEFGTANAAGTARFLAKILYRLYDASIMEYVGIVQSQQ